MVTANVAATLAGKVAATRLQPKKAL